LLNFELLNPGDKHMKDLLGSNSGWTGTMGETFSFAEGRVTQRLPRPMLLVPVTVSAVAVCMWFASVAGANTTHAAGIGYLCFALILFGCGLSFWTRARTAKGALRTRWSLISAATFAAFAGYLPSFTQFLLDTPPQRVLQTACFNASEALYMLAAVLFFAGVSRSIAIVDLLQAMLFILLRFNLVYSPRGSDHFTVHHLLVGQCVGLFLLVVALVSCLGAVSHGELIFLRTLSWFFGLKLICQFLSNQVSYTWLHYTNCSLWDVPGPVLMAGFSLYLVYTRPGVGSDAGANAPLASSVVVRTLMPSFLALVNLGLGLFLLRISIPFAAVAMSLSLACYVARTVLMQAQVMNENALLETHNEHLEGLAIRDPLTGIGNRRWLAEVYFRLQDENSRECLSLLAIDIDRFKQANDRYGHQHGDEVLVTLARKLEKLGANVHGSHCVRLGGDEFAVLLPRVRPEAASALAEKLCVSFRSHVFATGHSTVSLSIGIASIESARDLPLETFVCTADEALYRAKQFGRNRVEVHPIRGQLSVAG